MRPRFPRASIIVVAGLFLLSGLASVSSARPLPAAGGGPHSDLGSAGPVPATEPTSTLEPGAGLGAPNATPPDQTGEGTGGLSATAGQVLNTLVLQNRTLVPGNVQPSNNLSLGAMIYAPGPRSGTGYIYVVDSGVNAVTVVDAATYKVVVPCIPVGDDPTALVYVPAVDDVFVANSGSANVSVISVASEKVVGTVPTGADPAGVVYDNLTGYIYVDDQASDTLTVINPATLSVVRADVVGEDPGPVTFDSANGYLYMRTIAGGESCTLTVYDPVTGQFVQSGLSAAVTSEELCAGAGVYDGRADLLFFAVQYGVLVINGTLGTVVTDLLPLEGGSNPTALTFESWSWQVYVTGVVVTVQPQTYTSALGSTGMIIVPEWNGTGYVWDEGPLRVGPDPMGVTTDPVSREIFVSNDYSVLVGGDSNNLSVYPDNTSRPLASIGLAAAPSAEAFDRANGNLYIANIDGDNVSVFHQGTNRIVGSVPVGLLPDAVAYDSSNGDVYVANGGSGNVTVINGGTDSVVRSVTVGSLPDGLVLDQGTGDLYVANRYSDNVTVIDGTNDRVVTSVSVGVWPRGLALDNGTGSIVVANTLSNNVTVIDGGTNKVAVPGIAVGSRPLAVACDPTDGLIFVSSGGYGWGAVQVINAVTYELGRTYLYPGSDPVALTYDAARGYVYVANAGSGNLTVIGAASETVFGSIQVGLGPRAVALGRVGGYVYVANAGSGSVAITLLTMAYPVRTTATGLPLPSLYSEEWSPSLSEWYLNISGEPSRNSLEVNPRYSPMINETLPDGSYTYTATAADHAYASVRGSFIVDGAAVAISVAFVIPHYSVTFTETGLPSGTTWFVYIEGSTRLAYESSFGQTSAPSSIVLPEANGSYTVGAQSDWSGDYTPSPAEESFVVAGASLTILSHFIVKPDPFTGEVYPQYVGDFLTGISFSNSFAVVTWDGYLTASSVTGSIGATPVTFTPPPPGHVPWLPYQQTYAQMYGVWNGTVNLGSVSPGAVLNLNVTYSEEGYPSVWTLASYPLSALGVSIVESPNWLLSLNQKDPQPVLRTTGIYPGGHGYSLTWEVMVSLPDALSATLPLPGFAGGGLYSLMPSYELTFTFSSTGTGALGGFFRFGSGTVTAGPVSFGVSAAVTATGSFSSASGTLTWISGDLTLTIQGSSSVTVPVFGYSFTIFGYTITAGITATITVSTAFAVKLILQPLTNTGQEIIHGLDLMLAGLVGTLITVSISVSISLSLFIFSISGGGSLTLDLYLSASPVTGFWIHGGALVGGVSVTVSYLWMHKTVWHTSGTLFSWGTTDPLGGPAGDGALPAGSTPSSLGPASSTSGWSVTPRYYNTTNYDRLVWAPGAYDGVAVEDAYPQASATIVGDSSGATVFSTTDDVARPQTEGLTVGALAFNASSRTATPVSVPVPTYEIALDPKAVSLPNGSDAVLWNALPLAETSASNLSSITTSVLQLAYYDPATAAWSQVTNLTGSGYSQSYAIDRSSGGIRILDLLGAGIGAGPQQLVELSPTGEVLHSVSVANVSGIASFRAGSGLAVVQYLDAPTALLNVSSGATVPMNLGFSENDTEMSFVQGSEELLQALFAGANNTTMVLYNTSLGEVVGSYALPVNVSSVAVAAYDGRLFAVASEPDLLATYQLRGNSAQLFATRPAENFSAVSVAVCGSQLIVLGSHPYGNSSFPLLNLSLADVPLGTQTVTLQESGLPSGTEWFVNVTGGASYRSDTDTLSFSEWNGAYRYTIGTADPRYEASGGSFTVSGGPVSESVAFRGVTYPLTFRESGLPPGTAWWVNLTGGGSYRGTGATIVVPEANGTYGYSVGTSDKVYAASGASVTVKGAPSRVSVAFHLEMYVLTFQETGLPTGASWSVIVDGIVHRSTTSTILVVEPNSTYSYTVSGETGYTMTHPCGTIVVKGATTPTTVVFAPTSGGKGPSGVSSGEAYAAGAGIVVVAVAAALLFLRRRHRAPGGPPPGPPPPTR